MDYKDLLKKKPAELHKMLSEVRGELYGLKLKNNVNQLRDVRAIRKAKRDIARLQTAMTELTHQASTEAKKQ
jgi:large subunit ribosomal protein L29